MSRYNALLLLGQIIIDQQALHHHSLSDKKYYQPTEQTQSTR